MSVRVGSSMPRCIHSTLVTRDRCSGKGGFNVKRFVNNAAGHIEQQFDSQKEGSPGLNTTASTLTTPIAASIITASITGAAAIKKAGGASNSATTGSIFTPAGVCGIGHHLAGGR